MSRPYAFDVYVHVVGEVEIDLDDAVGARATLVLEKAPPGSVTDLAALEAPVEYHGMVASFEHLRAVHGSALYRLRLVPNLWELTLTRHSRIFTKKSVPEVIEEVLNLEGVSNFELRLSGAYEVEEHICQYRESSLDFIHRWMEREGMYYFFEQGDSEELLVITDDRARHALSVGGPIPYHPSEGDHSAGRHFNQFSARHAALPASVRLADYDYVKPQLDVVGTASVSPSGVGEVSLYGSRFFSSSQGARLAKVRAEDLRAQGKRYHATGAVHGLAPGFKFLVENHAKLSFNGEYLATEVEHFGFVADLAKPWGRAIPHDYDETYRVEVSAIAASQQYRHPEVTAWPRIDGYENAIVDGPATSDYAQIDDHGRYALKFKFDEGTLKDGKASTYVRKMQPHAGTVEGWHFPERKGTEVICAFLAGDPDRPVIVGAIPNAVTPSPVTSANNTKNVIQTGGFNRLEIEDLSGQQRVTLSTPHSNTHLLMGNPKEGHELIAKTDANALLHSGSTTDFKIGNLWNIDVTSHKTENLGATFTQTVQSVVLQNYNATHTVNVVADVTYNHSANFIHNVTADANQTVDGSHTQKIGADVTKKIGGHQTKNVGGNDKLTLAGDKTHDIGGNETKTIGASQTIEVAATSSETTGGKEEEHGWWNAAVKGVTDWTFEAAKSEKTYGAALNVFLGLKTEIVGGVEICLKGGAFVEAVAGVTLEAKAAAEFEVVGGLHARIRPVEEKTAGLESATTAAFLVESALVSISSGITSIESGIVAVEAGLVLLA